MFHFNMILGFILIGNSAKDRHSRQIRGNLFGKWSGDIL